MWVTRSKSAWRSAGRRVDFAALGPSEPREVGTNGRAAALPVPLTESAMFLLLACSTCSLDDTALTDGSPRDSAAVGAIELFDLSAAAADIPTVIRVS